MRVLASLAVVLTAVSGAALTLQSPFITSVSPVFVRPTGGDVVRLSGFNFRAPARVMLDFGKQSKEAQIVSLTQTQLEFISPAAESDYALAQIIGIFAAGTSSEQRTTAFTPLIYKSLALTPSINAVLPFSAPLIGGSRVSILGTGFEAPLQVFFDDLEAQVISVSFFEVVVIAPPGRAIGPVDLRVINVASGKSSIARDAFRYDAAMQILGVSPNVGPSFGGTRVRITGSGFNAAVAITIAGVPALPIHITSTEIQAITAPAISRPCNTTGPVTVISILNGDEASGGSFSYVCSPRRRAGR